MCVNDIFITENWAGQELLHPNFFVWVNLNDIFIIEKWAERDPLRTKFLIWMNCIFLLQDTVQDENFFALNFLYVCKRYCVLENWTGQELSPKCFICI